MNKLRAWLGIKTELLTEDAGLQQILDVLEEMDADQARYLAVFAYLLGRVAYADQHISLEETKAMNTLVEKEGRLPSEQATLVVEMAQKSTRVFGSTADFMVAREFGLKASYEEKLRLLHCLFAVSVADADISTVEEVEIHRISKVLRILPEDLLKLRLAHKKYLPGLKSSDDSRAK